MNPRGSNTCINILYGKSELSRLAADIETSPFFKITSVNKMAKKSNILIINIMTDVLSKT